MLLIHDQLQDILTAHALWLATDGAEGARANLQKADLQMLDLPGVDLRRARLDGANLQRADFTGARFDGASLRGANLEYARLEGASFAQADLSQTLAVGARLRGAHLSGANLDQANFSSVDGSEADFRGVRGRRAQFRRARLSKADFSESYFEETGFQSADLSEAKMRGASFLDGDLREANLSDVDLKGAVWEGALLDAEASGKAALPYKPSLQQARRALRLERRGKTLGEVARALDLPREDARLAMAEGRQLYEDSRQTASQRRLRRFALAAFALLAVGSLAELLAPLLFDRQASLSFAWYLIWGLLASGAALLLMAKTWPELLDLRFRKADRDAADSVSVSGEEA